MANPIVAVQSFAIPIQMEEFDGTLDPAVAGQFFQTNEMVGLDAAGFVTHFDDTQPLRFLGLVSNSVQVLAGSTETLNRVRIARPKQGFSMNVVGPTAPTDVGRVVYAAFSNQGTYSPGVNSNQIGFVKTVESPTVVTIEPLQFSSPTYSGVYQIPTSGSPTLSFLQMNKMLEWNGLVNQTVFLPAFGLNAGCDTFAIINTGNLGAQLTISGNGNQIMGGPTYLLSAAQWSSVNLTWDGVRWVSM